MSSVGATRKVLIVEDESLVAMLIEDLLSELGHEVAAICSRLDHAERAARDLEADFAVVDLNLNGERTFSVADILEQRGIPFVFATGYGAAGLEGRWSQVPVLQKPFQLHDLEAAISRIAAR